MGIFDEIKKALGGPEPRPSSRPEPRPAAGQRAARSPAGGALEAAQAKRRADRPLTRVKRKPFSDGRMQSYERLEWTIMERAGTFPFSEAQVRAALTHLEAAHVEAYLRSEAARKLLR